MTGRKHAAHAESEANHEAAPEGMVWCTITKAGHGKVHTGNEPGETFNRGARFLATIESAAELERRAYAEADEDLPHAAAASAEG